MAKYAIVMTANWKFIPGVNGMLNALKYYDCDDIELHLIHHFKTPKGSHDQPYIESAKRVFPNLVSTYLPTYRDAVRAKYNDLDATYNKLIMKWYRWRYVLDYLMDYDAICVLDADRQIVNNLRPFFDMTARSGMILIAKNDFSRAELGHYDKTRAMKAQPPIYSNPFFAAPKKVEDLFRRIPEFGIENQTGDMTPINYLILDMNLTDEILLLPATQWVFVNSIHLRLVKRVVNGHLCIGTHKTGDLLYTYHRRYWGPKVCERIVTGRRPQDRNNSMNNTQILCEMTQFFNTECYHNIDWDFANEY